MRYSSVTHEGAYVIKVSKLQMVTTKFENIRMHENQNFFFLIL